MSLPLVPLPLRTSDAVAHVRRLKWWLLIAVLMAALIAARLVQNEIETSRLQAHYLSGLGHDIRFIVAGKASNAIRFPATGPYDVRLGYTLLPGFEQRLVERGFTVTAQARDSAAMISMADHGLFLPYPEKDQAGLLLLDASGVPLYGTRYPERIYDTFEAVPAPVANALLFIEDHNLLDEDQPSRNPAIDWGRFSRALFDQGVRVFDRQQTAPGGSTLATQIEKFRHSAGGRTGTPREKLRQIASASMRAYLDGPQTLAVRRQIVVHYLNTVPLAAAPGVGEIAGIGDGLADWYGRDFDEVNHLLAAPQSLELLDAQALAFKQALSLMIAQRAPSYYLRHHPQELNRLTDSYVRLLAANRIISMSLRDQALASHLELQAAAQGAGRTSFVERKAVTSLRARLLEALGLPSFYALDRLDLTAHSTLDGAVQHAVSERLVAATTPEGAKAAGLYGFEMLREKDDPSKLAYSFTLFEQRDGANLMRVQTDNVNQPFDINQGARLNLGSTAKLRTLITYLQIITALHDRFAPMSEDELHDVRPDPQDVLTSWALDYILHSPDRSLSAMLDAAVERQYSANPREIFYTGGGAQTFTNFESSDNSRILSVHLAFQHSVNLVFVRLMRDIVQYEMTQIAGPSTQWLADINARKMYLTRFADQESRVYMHRFYVKYQGRHSTDALALLLGGVHASPVRVATVLRSVAPNGSQAWFDTQMRSTLKGTAAAAMSEAEFAKLYAQYSVAKFNLNDRGYLAGVHPLELWLVNYLRNHPDASEHEVQEASGEARIAAYSWLFKTRYQATQDRRIKRMVERQAYEMIGKSWNVLGYPFDTLTPSFAAAIGASGDRPAALAQLIGVVASGGKILPTQSISGLEFAKNTPYETQLKRVTSPEHSALPPEIVAVVHHLLRDVVLGGTGKRLADGMQLPDGQTLEVYGKTGTGDQRYDVYGHGARLIESRKVNRSATFVFVIGKHFFGTLTVYVHEPYAARYAYTSALSVQLLKSMTSVLQPLIGEDGDGATQSAGGTLAQQARIADPVTLP
jgi:membrane peptidoglycan carboxypeptidase